FARVIVASTGGTPVYLGQIAEVVDGEAEETSISRVDGRRAVALDIFKVQGSNIVSVGDGVAEKIALLKKELPPDVTIKTIYAS
ncbi:efflux RND transporter permease subunit, partial [Escherichia coli]|uniref:efflux RND transporter permease subunit n=2 Tax=Gammaproteobacteria TaxID=1236 RepID=UPI00215AA19E